MVRWLLIVAILAAGAFFGYQRFFSEEGHVRQTLSVAETCFHKEKPETEAEARARVHELAERLAPGCCIEIPEGTYKTVLNEKTLEPMLAVFRKYCRSTFFSFEDVDIQLTDATTARVTGDLFFQGHIGAFGFDGRDARAFTATLRRDGKTGVWRFTAIRFDPIIRKFA